MLTQTPFHAWDGCFSQRTARKISFSACSERTNCAIFSPMQHEIIAEIGQNYNGDIALAGELIRQAKKAGADVAKFQLFDARKTFPPREKNEWFDYNLKSELTREQLRSLADICAKEE